MGFVIFVYTVFSEVLRPKMVKPSVDLMPPLPMLKVRESIHFFPLTFVFYTTDSLTAAVAYLTIN